MKRCKKGRPMAGTHSDGGFGSRSVLENETTLTVAYRESFDKSQSVTGEDFLRASPVPLPLGRDGRQDAADLFKSLFGPPEYVFAAWNRRMPAVLGRTIRTRREWEAVFADLSHPIPILFLPNPISPVPSPTKNGKEMTLRGAKSILAFRHCAVELGDLPLSRQFAVWWRVREHLTALVGTGTGSLQALVRVDLPNLAAWNAVVRDELYPKRLAFLGCTPFCLCPTFLARVAGAGRALVTRQEVKTRPSEEVPPLVRQTLWYVKPELKSEIGGVL